MLIKFVVIAMVGKAIKVVLRLVLLEVVLLYLNKG